MKNGPNGLGPGGAPRLLVTNINLVLLLLAVVPVEGASSFHPEYTASIVAGHHSIRGVAGWNCTVATWQKFFRTKEWVKSISCIFYLGPSEPHPHHHHHELCHRHHHQFCTHLGPSEPQYHHHQHHH